LQRADDMGSIIAKLGKLAIVGNKPKAKEDGT